MVASDTVVGLVGAGILLIALAGVFIVESQDTATDVDLQEVRMDLGVGGNLTLQSAQGEYQTLPTGQRVCTPPGPCRDALTDLNAALVGPGSVAPQVFFVAWLMMGESGARLGEFQLSDEEWTCCAPLDEDHLDADEFRITLETSATPTAPSAIVIYMTAIDAGAADKADLDVAGTVPGFTFASGDASASVTAVSAGLQVDVTLNDAQNHTGFQYRVWLGPAANTTGGSSWRFVGYLNGTGEETIDASLQESVAGANAETYDFLYITLERASAQPGNSPGGVYVWQDEIG